MKPLHTFKKAAKKAGFTLIELSIVLVIIGLIVGGILVGQDLIKAAEIRATVSQLEKYATAVNTFRSKYSGLPGDLVNGGNFGFDPLASGDGDAVIESATTGGANTFIGETSCFWDELSTAAMISDSLNANTTCFTDPAATMVGGIPQSKLGRGNYIIVGSNAGINYWGLTGVTAISGAGVYTLDDLLTTSEAFQIDSKIDDGGATSGSVMSMGDGANADGTTIWTTPDASGAAAGAGVCVDTTTAGAYSFATNSGNDQACQLRLRSNF